MATASNTAATEYSEPTGTWGDPTHYAIHTHATDWAPILTDALSSDVSAPVSGATVRFAAGDLTIDLSGGDLTDSGWQRALQGLLADTVYISLHTSTPASSNELTGNGYGRASMALAAWTIS